MAGRVSAERRRSGEYFYFGYDNLDRTILRDAPGSQPDVTLGYDLLGRVISDSQPGLALTMVYDALSRVRSVTSSVLGTVSYQYDAASRRTRLTYPDGFFVSYAYDATGALIALQENGGAALASFSYDLLGRRTTLTRGNGVTTTTAFDAASRLASLVQDPAGGAHDTTLGFSYNPANQATARTRTNGVYDYVLPGTFTESYTADGLNRYTSSARGQPELRCPRQPDE